MTPPRARADRPAEEETSFGRYSLIARLASGGMGEIYLARLRGDAGFEKLVVLKRLLPELVADEQFVTMFLHEARIAARLSHSNICDVYELGCEDGRYFIAMQYLQGVPFTAVMAQRPGADDGERVRLPASLVQQACEGLHHAHELTDDGGQPLRLVHRDVSPSNLFVTVDGVLKVLDFGIAKARGAPSLTERGEVKGKTAYMSPEQLSGDPVDRRSDVFSLATVLWEAVTGERLFQRATHYLTAKAVLEEPIPRADTVSPAVPPALADAIAAALARDRRHRPPSARALGTAIGAAIAPLGGTLSSAVIGETIRDVFAGELRAQQQRRDHAVEASSRARPAFLDRHTRSLPHPAAAIERDDDRAEPTEPAEPDDTTVAIRGGAAAPKRPRGWIAIAALAAVLIPAAAYHFAGRGPQTTQGATQVTHAAAATRPPAPHPAAKVAPAAAAAQTTENRAAAAQATENRAAAEVAPPARPAPRSHPRRTAPRRSHRRATASPTHHRHSSHRPHRRAAAHAPPGSFSIDSEPYATIYIDGARVGITPLIALPVPAGHHRVKAVLQDGRSRTFGIDIQARKAAPPRHLYW